MDAVKFLQERARMCNSFSPDCEGCRVDEEKPVMGECYMWMFENHERAVKIIEEWSAAHPRKTRQDAFLEQWPNAQCIDGILVLCPGWIDTCFSCPIYGNNNVDCATCRHEFWMQEVE